MANVSITTACNRDCAYCFARGEADARRAAPHMSQSTFTRALDLLTASGPEEVRLLGGEPTLHPLFPRFLQQALDRVEHVGVFSNGAMPDAALEALEQTAQDRVLVLINATWGVREDAAAHQAQLRALERLGPRACLGLNLLRAPVALTGLAALYERFTLGRELRLGMAHPAVGRANQYAHPKHYEDVAADVTEIARWAHEEGVQIGFDCGFVPCAFPPEAWDMPALASALEDCGRRCGPIPDILVDGRMVPCHPLSALASVRLDAVESTQQAREMLRDQLAAWAGLGVYRHCTDCELMQAGRCTGGCLAAAHLRLRSADAATPGVRGPTCRSLPTPAAPGRPQERDGSASGDATHGVRERWSIPYVDQDIAFWEELVAAFGDSIGEVYLPLPGSRLGSGRPPQASERVAEFLASGLVPVSALVNPVVLREPAEAVASEVVESIRALSCETRLSSVTVANVHLAEAIRRALPDVRLVASTLMDLCDPLQVSMLEGLFDVLVPSSRIMRDMRRLGDLRAAFSGGMRLIVNEACLPGCPVRVQHFYEMNGPSPAPPSLCAGLLARRPWLRLTGAWVLPQHLHLYEGIYDELKLAGRVTLRDPVAYRCVLGAYVLRQPLDPSEIGSGPAGVNVPLDIAEAFFRRTLECSRDCARCGECEAYWAAHAPGASALAPSSRP